MNQGTTTKRKVEVFTAGCGVCEPTVNLVKEMACSNCDVVVHNLKNDDAFAKAHEYGVKKVPAVVVDGKLAACCVSGAVTREGLEAAGIGKP